MEDQGPGHPHGPEGPVATRDRRFAIGLALITLGAFAFRLYLLTSIARRNPDGGDPFYYHAQANFLVEGKVLGSLHLAESQRLVPSAIHPPLFTLWLAILSVLGFKGFLAHKVMSCLAGALAVTTIGLLGKEVGGRRWGSWRRWWPRLPAALAVPIDGQLWPEGLFTALRGPGLLPLRAHRRPGCGGPRQGRRGPGRSPVARRDRARSLLVAPIPAASPRAPQPQPGRPGGGRWPAPPCSPLMVRNATTSRALRAPVHEQR
ncbi:MAG: hypothetical protein R2746_08940 [Acidimicrobiales bacterium]